MISTNSRLKKKVNEAVESSSSSLHNTIPESVQYNFHPYNVPGFEVAVYAIWEHSKYNYALEIRKEGESVYHQWFKPNDSFFPPDIAMAIGVIWNIKVDESQIEKDYDNMKFTPIESKKWIDVPNSPQEPEEVDPNFDPFEGQEMFKENKMNDLMFDIGSGVGKPIHCYMTSYMKQNFKDYLEALKISVAITPLPSPSPDWFAVKYHWKLWLNKEQIWEDHWAITIEKPEGPSNIWYFLEDFTKEQAEEFISKYGTTHVQAKQPGQVFMPNPAGFADVGDSELEGTEEEEPEEIDPNFDPFAGEEMFKEDYHNIAYSDEDLVDQFIGDPSQFAGVQNEHFKASMIPYGYMLVYKPLNQPLLYIDPENKYYLFNAFVVGTDTPVVNALKFLKQNIENITWVTKEQMEDLIMGKGYDYSADNNYEDDDDDEVGEEIDPNFDPFEGEEMFKEDNVYNHDFLLTKNNYTFSGYPFDMNRDPFEWELNSTKNLSRAFVIDAHFGFEVKFEIMNDTMPRFPANWRTFLKPHGIKSILRISVNQLMSDTNYMRLTPDSTSLNPSSESNLIKTIVKVMKSYQRVWGKSHYQIIILSTDSGRKVSFLKNLSAKLVQISGLKKLDSLAAEFMGGKSLTTAKKNFYIVLKNSGGPAFHEETDNKWSFLGEHDTPYEDWAMMSKLDKYMYSNPKFQEVNLYKVLHGNWFLEVKSDNIYKVWTSPEVNPTEIYKLLGIPFDSLKLVDKKEKEVSPEEPEEESPEEIDPSFDPFEGEEMFKEHDEDTTSAAFAASPENASVWVRGQTGDEINADAKHHLGQMKKGFSSQLTHKPKKLSEKEEYEITDGDEVPIYDIENNENKPSHPESEDFDIDPDAFDVAPKFNSFDNPQNIKKGDTVIITSKAVDTDWGGETLYKKVVSMIGKSYQVLEIEEHSGELVADLWIEGHHWLLPLSVLHKLTKGESDAGEFVDGEPDEPEDPGFNPFEGEEMFKESISPQQESIEALKGDAEETCSWHGHAIEWGGVYHGESYSYENGKCVNCGMEVHITTKKPEGLVIASTDKISGEALLYDCTHELSAEDQEEQDIENEEPEEESYEEMQDHAGFQVGDKVKVMGKAESKEQGWNTYWVPSMDKMIGGVYEIQEIDESNGILLKGEEGDFQFPYFVLVSVSDDTPLSNGTYNPEDAPEEETDPSFNPFEGEEMFKESQVKVLQNYSLGHIDVIDVIARDDVGKKLFGDTVRYKDKDYRVHNHPKIGAYIAIT